MKRCLIYSVLLSIVLVTACGKLVKNKAIEAEPEDCASLVRRANIVYDSTSFQSGYPYVPLMVSNGIVGGTFDHMGFQWKPNYDWPESRTVFGYISNYEKHESSRQIQFPLAHIQASFADGSPFYNLMEAKDYHQELDLYTGTLSTKYDLFGKTEITAFAHQTIPNLFVFHIERNATDSSKNIVISIDCETSEEQNNQFAWKVNPIKLSFKKEGRNIHITSITNLSKTDWVISSNEQAEVVGERVNIPLSDRINDIRIFVNRSDCPGIEVLDKPYTDLLASHSQTWKDIWATSWVNLPEERAHNIWTRMKYYAISHFPVITEKPMLPSGLCSNIWGFTFPQDVYYVAENLPRLGHADRSAKAMQYWLDILPEVKKYSMRVMGVEGGYYPWTPPYADWANYEKYGAVSPDSYELHNPAYVAAMVYHHYQKSGDMEFLQKYFPIIEEVTRFYKNIAIKNSNGKYDIYHENARGQDENSSTDGKLKNLLCASYSAEYTFRTYLDVYDLVDLHEENLFNEVKDILASGLSRENLMTKYGWYSTYEGDDRGSGHQKHPVQLNPIAYLPMADMCTDDSPVVKAWQNRYELTIDAKKPITLGWTFGEFALASTRMGSPIDLEKDLSAIQPCRGADPRWIQFYESSYWQGWHMNKAYYFPMMALYLQAFTDVLVQDWQGYTELFHCLLPGWENNKLAFHGIKTIGGATVSGEWNNGKLKITIYKGESEQISLKMGIEAGIITAKGQKSGPDSFKSGELVELSFDGNNPIILNN